MKRNIAVVGSGYWGKNLVRNFAGLGALHTVCDVDTNGLAELKVRYPEVNLETDFSRVLQDEEIAGVVIATPAALHFKMAKEALQAGKDTFVEKPLSLKNSEGRELVALSEAAGKILMVGHLLEYHPAVIKLKELISSGALGKIQYIYSNRLNLGKIRTEENILWSFAPHDISVILSLLGAEMPAEISTHGGYYLHHDIADVTVTNMSFHSGVSAHIFVSWLHPYKEQRLVVIGDGKMAEFNDTSKDKLVIFKHEIEWVDRRPVPRRGEPEVISIPADEPLKLECQEFIDCIDTRRQPKTDGHNGLRVLEILSLCQQSLEAGGKTLLLEEKQPEYYVHESSIIEEPSHIGRGTKIWHFCHVMPDAVIGEDCSLGQNTYVGNKVSIGNRVKIQNNVSVYDAVTLEDDVFCGPSCVFTNVVNPRAHVSRKHDYRQTLVKKGATIGANATIVCGHAVGRYAFIGAGAVVTKDVPDHAMVYGNPARIQGWVCECGVKLEGTSTLTCPECGRKYRLDKERGTIIELKSGKTASA
jgi:UDP-2-acetamido-3-amino-2,3-dideoxy-glucuronate N-acetyltransferase